MQKPNIVIANLDSTTALIDHRRHWLDAKLHPDMTLDERWRKFFAECVSDQWSWPVIHTLQDLQRAGYYIHVFSGRFDEVLEQTIDWLEAFNFPYHHLRMRAAGDYTPDEELKRQWIEGYKLEHILCVFDDRQKVVDMWRSLGLARFQVAPGDF
jgi:phosphoglycolate phosphatase-like HAD superfamily hydrolase